MRKPVGLTGNIGSGKSTVARLLASLPNVTIVPSDSIAKEVLLDPMHAPRFRAVLELPEDEAIVARRVADIIFTNPQKLATLEQALIPLAWGKIGAVCERAPEGNLVVVESAIIYEKHLEDRFSCIVAAVCPRDVRVRRLLEMRGMERSDIERRIALQLPEEELVRRADYTISTDCTLEELEERARVLYRKLVAEGERS